MRDMPGAKDFAPNTKTGGLFRSCTMKCRKNLAQTDPCCNGNDKYKPILMTQRPSISQKLRDKAIDFKCGTQLQTYRPNTHKVANFPQRRGVANVLNL